MSDSVFHFGFLARAFHALNVGITMTSSTLLSSEVPSVDVRDDADESQERRQREKLFLTRLERSDVMNKNVDPEKDAARELFHKT